MIVASYAAAPLEAAKWLVKIWIYKNASLKVCDMLHHVPCLTASDYMCIFLTSHLLFLALRTVTVGSKHLKAFLHSWLLSSDAYGICYASVVTCVLANKSKFARTRAIRGKQQIETSPTNKKKSPMPKHRGLLLNRSRLQFLS